jgi:hypothetical protein
MYSRILDEATLGAVIAAAPKVGESPLELAQRLVERLAGTTEVEPGPVYELNVSGLAVLLGVSAHQAGRVARELGLRTERKRTGYVVYWNRAQLDILRGAMAKRSREMDCLGEASLSVGVAVKHC